MSVLAGRLVSILTGKQRIQNFVDLRAFNAATMVHPVLQRSFAMF